MHKHAPKSPKELGDPEISDPIEKIISESEKSHISGLYSSVSANDLRVRLATLVNQFNWKNRQLSRHIHNWSEATNDEVRWLPNYQTAESKAQRFLRRFIDKTGVVSPELFEDYTLS